MDHQADNPVRPTAEALPERTNPSALARLLDEFAQGDETEQRETFESLKRALDAGRRPGFKLFTRE